MSEATRQDREHDTPSLSDALIFRAKATLLQVKRAALNLSTSSIARFQTSERLAGSAVVAQSRTPLWTNNDEHEKHLLAGKVHNLRLAIRRLDGVEIPASAIFSFWAQVGQASRWKGYVAGRELREGCIIPAIGGGLCQLSNALYDAALKAGFEIVERHAHTRALPGSLAEVGRDATVFWNYVDLRFKSSRAFRIEAMMDADFLTVRFRSGLQRDAEQAEGEPERSARGVVQVAPQSCFTCAALDCFRHVERKPDAKGFGRAAYLVDDYYPEFDDYIRRTRRERDLLAVPLDGKRFGKRNYAWSTQGFQQVRQSWANTMLRAYRSRRLAEQGAVRQRALLSSSERLARGYARLLKYDVGQVTVMQNLLPFLWRDGYLGGRTFDVLMTTLPLARLHQRLDMAAALHPESRPLADFRADERLVRAELAALEQARRIITPHTEVAALYADKAVLVDWAMPPKKLAYKRGNGARVIFPAATVGRKGAYELRAAVRGLDLQLITLGAQLEGTDFWRGLPVENRVGDASWLEGASVVVLPAFVEHRPRRLLEAVACGVPVIASTACGLENVEGVINIPIGDAKALREQLERVISEY
jgi:hypothetical protein